MIIQTRPFTTVSLWIDNQILYLYNMASTRGGYANGSVEEMSTDGRNHRVLNNRLGSTPTGIVVDSTNSLLYWTDSGSSPGIYKMAATVGAPRVAIVTNNTIWPRALAVDFQQSLMYWCDAKHLTIEMANLDGSGRKVLHQDTFADYFGMALTRNYLYVTGLKRSYFRKIDRSGRLKPELSSAQKFRVLSGIALYIDQPNPGKVYNSQPLNKAAVTRNRTSFICISNSSSTLSWRFKQIDQTADTMVVHGCELNPAYEGVFGLENIATGRCDLVVLNADATTHAGQYGCQAGFDIYSAQLAVLNSDPVCIVEPLEPVNGDNVTLTCQVSYTSNISPMTMSWTDSQGLPVEGSLVQQDGLTTSSIVFIAAQPALPPYTCTTTFTEPEGLPSSATNTPDYRHEWTSSELVVKDEPVAPLNTAAVVGDTVKLNCRLASTQISWSLVRADYGISQVLAVDCQPVASVRHLFDTDSTDGACNLIIRSLTLDLAGTYSCQDLFSDETLVSAAEVTALESAPICSLKETRGRIPELTSVQFTSQVSYTGKIPPAFRWVNETQDEVAMKYCTTNSTYVECAMVQLAYYPSLGPYTCVLYFNPPTVDPPPHHDLATNAPSYTARWTSQPVPVYG